jgi:hypothetical protein
MINKRNEIGYLRWLAVLTVLLCAFSAAAAPVRVKVFETTDANGATYFYRAENGTTQPIVTLRIGFDYLHGEAQLHALPAGWTFEQGVPQSSTTSPNGWTPRLVTTEESALVDMEWSSDGGSQFDIAPGATATGFSVRLPQASSEYRTVNFDVILGDSTHVYGVLEPDTEGPPPPPSDTTAPTLSVSLSPAVIFPPNDKLVAITATVNVSDDTDPNPAVRLVSITCNEAIDAAADITGAAFGTDDRQFSVRAGRAGQRKEGRVYTVTYSATDAAGNQATATATVKIPHDQRH